MSKNGLSIVVSLNFPFLCLHRQMTVNKISAQCLDIPYISLVTVFGTKILSNARRRQLWPLSPLRPLSQQLLRTLIYQDLKTALETTLLIMAITSTILRPPEHRPPLSASSFARTGLEDAHADSGLGKRWGQGDATSRRAWKAKSMPYNSMGRCIQTTMSIMHLEPGNATLW